MALWEIRHQRFWGPDEGLFRSWIEGCVFMLTYDSWTTRARACCSVWWIVRFAFWAYGNNRIAYFTIMWHHMCVCYSVRFRSSRFSCCTSARYSAHQQLTGGVRSGVTCDLYAISADVLPVLALYNGKRNRHNLNYSRSRIFTTTLICRYCSLRIKSLRFDAHFAPNQIKCHFKSW